jgi:hypothetical protein
MPAPKREPRFLRESSTLTVPLRYELALRYSLDAGEVDFNTREGALNPCEQRITLGRFSGVSEAG